MMPGMVGTELAMKLKHGRPDLRVLLISGYTDPTGVAELEDEVGMAFMRKPFTLSDLRVKLAGLMAVPTD
jgi:CheY-like chemotaxis protein